MDARPESVRPMFDNVFVHPPDFQLAAVAIRAITRPRIGTQNRMTERIASNLMTIEISFPRNWLMSAPDC